MANHCKAGQQLLVDQAAPQKRFITCGSIRDWHHSHAKW